MTVTELSLTNFRGYSNATFLFKPGVNVIAGVNGAGKSTALDALRILLSRAIRSVHGRAQATEPTSTDDIRQGSGFYDISATILGSNETTYEFLGHQNRHELVASGDDYHRSSANRSKTWRERLIEAGMDPDLTSAIERPSDFAFFSEIPSTDDLRGFALFFSPHRSIITKEATGSTLQFSQALTGREFNVRQAAEWWVAQNALALEPGASERFAKRSKSLNSAVQKFLPGEIQCVRPRPTKPGRKVTKDLPEIKEVAAKLTAVKGLRRFDLGHLSDGERSVISLVMEIARRLTLAYPSLADPIQDGSACVLIDEIELHLHPLWQRSILKSLEQTFPSCQFIVTTHSPTVVSEVEHERIWIVDSDRIWQPDRSLGLDVSRVIEELMGGQMRNSETSSVIGHIAQLLDKGMLSEARSAIDKLAIQIGEDDPEVLRASGLINFLEAEVDSD